MAHMVHGCRLIPGSARQLGTSYEPYATADIFDLHIALSRNLLLQGAFKEARGQAAAAERLPTIFTGQKGVDDGLTADEVRPSLSDDAYFAAVVAVRFEIALLSHTPVVLESVEQAILLRNDLIAELERLTCEPDFWGYGAR